MRRLIVFNNVSVDGYFVDRRGGMSWAHARADDEWNAFVEGNASGAGGLLLFGRVTYEMMASFWPTPFAKQQLPVVAEGMNSMQKVVFSRTLKDATWSNTRLVQDDLIEEVRKLKQEPGKDIVVMGSGSIVSQLAQARLVDEFQLVVHPIALGSGRTLFEGAHDPLQFKHVSTRTFRNGNVLVCYAPA